MGAGAQASEAGLVRLVAQMAGHQACLDMIGEHEHRHGRRFDWVTRTRPDVGVLAPVRPWCAYEAKLETPRPPRLHYPFGPASMCARLQASQCHEPPRRP